MTKVIQTFMPELIAGFLVNLQVAGIAISMGLALGVPLALLRQRVLWSIRLLRPCIMLMQAAPVYVIMFFLLNLLPDKVSVVGTTVLVSGFAALSIAQGVNMIAYIAENAFPALEHFRRDEMEQAMLFLPAVLRGFIVVVMSSGIGAAIGIPEAVGVTLAHAQRLPALSDRVLLFLITIAFFVSIFGVINALLRSTVRRLASGRHKMTII
ncbi:MAG: hypothetical protein AB7F35_17445 [Acetobacteraceae bacterium]